jgi:hypothetical protein
MVSLRYQANFIYFDPSRSFNVVPHILLLHNLGAFGLSGGCVKKLFSQPRNQPNRHSQDRVSGIRSPLVEVLSSAPQGSVPEPLLFSVLINHLRN